MVGEYSAQLFFFLLVVIAFQVQSLNQIYTHTVFEISISHILTQFVFISV